MPEAIIVTDSEKNRFKQPGTRVRINPETYIKFDDSSNVMLGNVFSDGNAMSIQSDILLLLWDLTNWKTVEEILSVWPDPADHSKITEHLASMYACKVIVTDESEIQSVNDSGLSNKLGSKIHINVANHHVMMKDNVRLAAYRRAIDNAVTPDSIVMDLGCGSGILSFFAAQKKAAKVYAIEKRTDVIQLAEALATENKFEQIKFIEGTSTTVHDSVFKPKPDIFISEILGNGILEENVLEFTIDARDRLCKPDATLIPYKLDIYVFAYHSALRQDKRQEVNEFSDLYGVDYSLFGDVLCKQTATQMTKFNPHTDRPITEAKLVKSLDFRTLKNTIFTESFELDIIEDGNFSGYCSFFKAWLDETTCLSNSPWAPNTHWTQLLNILPASKKVKKGETLKMDIIYDGNLRIRLLDSD